MNFKEQYKADNQMITPDKKLLSDLGDKMRLAAAGGNVELPHKHALPITAITRYAAIAACACLVIGAAVLLPQMLSNEGIASEAPSVTVAMDTIEPTAEGETTDDSLIDTSLVEDKANDADFADIQALAATSAETTTAGTSEAAATEEPTAAAETVTTTRPAEVTTVSEEPQDNTVIPPVATIATAVSNEIESILPEEPEDCLIDEPNPGEGAEMLPGSAADGVTTDNAPAYGEAEEPAADDIWDDESCESEDDCDVDEGYEGDYDSYPTDSPEDGDEIDGENPSTGEADCPMADDSIRDIYTTFGELWETINEPKVASAEYFDGRANKSFTSSLDELLDMSAPAVGSESFKDSGRLLIISLLDSSKHSAVTLVIDENGIMKVTKSELSGSEYFCLSATKVAQIMNRIG